MGWLLFILFYPRILLTLCTIFPITKTQIILRAFPFLVATTQFVYLQNITTLTFLKLESVSASIFAFWYYIHLVFPSVGPIAQRFLSRCKVIMHLALSILLVLFEINIAQIILILMLSLQIKRFVVLCGINLGLTEVVLRFVVVSYLISLSWLVYTPHLILLSIILRSLQSLL